MCSYRATNADPNNRSQRCRAAQRNSLRPPCDVGTWKVFREMSAHYHLNHPGAARRWSESYSDYHHLTTAITIHIRFEPYHPSVGRVERPKVYLLPPRIRGSRIPYMRSASRLKTTTVTAEISIQAATAYRSLALMASMRKFPKPRH